MDWMLQTKNSNGWETIVTGEFDTCLKSLFDMWYDSPEGVDYLDQFRITDGDEEVIGDSLYNAIASCK